MKCIQFHNFRYDDLIVGAPYYYKRNRGGAIYVYLGGEKMVGHVYVFPFKLCSVFFASISY